jgi:hypothetical protein
VLAPGRVRAAHFTLALGGTGVAGTVRDAGGTPIVHATVSFPFDAVVARTDEDGAFRAWLRGGAFDATAIADGYAPATVRAVTAGSSLALTLSPEAVLEGRVVEEGRDVPGCAVRASPTTASSIPGATPIAVTDAAGHFRFRGLAAGRYQPMAACATHRGVARESVPIAAGTTVKDILVETTPSAYVRGRVERADGHPCEAAHVRLADDAQHDLRDALAGEDGDVLFEALAPGTYHASISCPGTYTRASELAIPVERAPVTGIVWHLANAHGDAVP